MVLSLCGLLLRPFLLAGLNAGLGFDGAFDHGAERGFLAGAQVGAVLPGEFGIQALDQGLPGGVVGGGEVGLRVMAGAHRGGVAAPACHVAIGVVAARCIAADADFYPPAIGGDGFEIAVLRVQDTRIGWQWAGQRQGCGWLVGRGGE